MGLLFAAVPGGYKWLAALALVAALLAFGWIKGAAHVQGRWDAEAAAQTLRAARIETRQAEATVKVVTEYVDRVRVVREKAQTIIKEIPVYVTQEADSACVVPHGFVVVHDAAASNTLPPPPGPADAAPAAVALSAVAATVADNYGLCHENATQLVALQEWIHEMIAAQP